MLILTDLKIDTERMLDKLPPRLKFVIMARYGFFGHKMTLKETGEFLGVKTESCRQIEAKALRMLRHPKMTAYIRDYYKELVFDFTRSL